MHINKAIRKQYKSYRRFMLTMCFIFFSLPLVLYFSNKYNIFLIVYLGVIEILIVAAILLRMDWQNLKYRCEDGKIQITQGIIGKRYNINCEKVVFVHSEKADGRDEIDLILITSSRFRNKNIKDINREFFKRYPRLSYDYNKIKFLYPEENYFYIVISKGGYIKYRLLGDIYKNCVKAKYSSDAIDSIKLYD